MIRNKAISLVLACSLLAGGVAYAGGKGPNNPKNGAKAQNGKPLRPRAGEWLSQHKNLSPAEQQKALSNDPKFQQLPPQQQQQLQNRLTQFNNLPPEKKDQVLERMKVFDSMTPEQQQKARDLQGKLRDVPENRRKMMQLALRNLRQMDPQQREQVLNSDRFKNTFNDNERSILGGLADLPMGKGTQQQPDTAQQPAPQNAQK